MIPNPSSIRRLRLGTFIFGWIALFSFFLAPVGQAATDKIVERGPFMFDTSKLKVSEFVGRLTVEVRDAAGMELTLSGPEEELDRVEFDASGDTLVLDYKQRDWSLFRSWSKKPRVTIKVSEGTAVKIEKMIGRLRVGDTHAPFELRLVSGNAKIGAVSEANVTIKGSGDVDIKAVAGRFEGTVMGSGDLDVGNAGPSEIKLMGSGDISVGTINGDLEAMTAGSGEVTIGKVVGDINFSGAGSGDCMITEVQGRLTLKMAGSGDCMISGGKAQDLKLLAAGSGDIKFGGSAVGEIEIASAGSATISVNSVEGKLKASIKGSGDIMIAEGRAKPLHVEIRGSGNFEFDGIAEDADLYIKGSGDIRIREVNGSIKQRTKGSGTIDIG